MHSWKTASQRALYVYPIFFFFIRTKRPSIDGEFMTGHGIYGFDVLHILCMALEDQP